MKTSAMRSRWAAIGAAVAVTLGAGGIGLVAATSPADAVTYVPLDEPCRAADTRPEFNVGPRSTPLGADETHTINANDGDCAGQVAASATSVLLNVTAVDATAPTFLTIWASGPRPDASSLNPAPGLAAVPNAVTTAVTGANDFQVFNRFGSVDVVVDVIGYYTDHHHDDRYYTETEVDTRLGATKSINLPAIMDTDGNADAPWGVTPGFDTTFVLPPDYTPGTVMTLQVSLITQSDPCSLDARPNYSYAFRPGVGTLDDDGGSVSGMLSAAQTVNMPNTSGGAGGRAAALIEFTVDRPGTIPLQPGDAVSLGLFFGGSSTCSLADSHFHAAQLLYS